MEEFPSNDWKEQIPPEAAKNLKTHLQLIGVHEQEACTFRRVVHRLTFSRVE